VDKRDRTGFAIAAVCLGVLVVLVVGAFVLGLNGVL
jgi:hypothetical protein